MNFKDPRTNWNYILLILFFAAVVGGSVLVYQTWFIPRQEIVVPTAMPKEEQARMTYRNETYGFEIKYLSSPDKDVVINTTTYYMGFCNLGNSVASIEIYPKGTVPYPYEFNGDALLAVNVKENPRNLSIDEWIAENCQNDWPLNSTRENIKVAGLNAVKLTSNYIEFGPPEDQPLIIFEKGGLLYFLNPYGDRTIWSEMLSSFNFFR